MSADKFHSPNDRRPAPADQPLSPPVQALIELSNQVLPSLSESELGARWSRIKRRNMQCMNARRGWLAVATIAAAATVAAAVTFVVALKWDRANLTYEISGTPVLARGYVQTDANQDAAVRFSDGSDVNLTANARLRLESIRADAPRLVLEGGEARVHVHHRQGARWSVQAGPFVVAVTGTSFVLGWNAEQQRLHLHLQSGSVQVSGPISADQVTVHEGQVLSIALREKEVVLRDYQDPAAAAAPSQPATPVAPSPRHAGGAPPSADGPPVPASFERRSTEVSHHWAAKLSAGKASQILGEARALGIDRVLGSSSRADLEALADAARYRGQETIGRTALLSERRRYPATTGAQRAAFLLGRLEEASGRWTEALGWYETYLNESPDGPHASGALAGKMATVQKLYGTEKARIVAQDYLRRFPDGSYASAARTLMNLP